LCCCLCVGLILVAQDFAPAANAAYAAHNYAEALRLTQPAAEKGDPRAQVLLGDMYRLGRGVSKDAAQAAGWYRKAAAQGNAAGQYHLGAMLTAGLGVARNYPEAMRWHLKAAAQGYAASEFEIGLMHWTGFGAEIDKAVGLQWFRKADRGNADAQFYLRPSEQSNRAALVSSGNRGGRRKGSGRHGTQL
jgi:hypothetical protein